MNMKKENKSEIKQKMGFARCFAALLALCAVSAVYGNETGLSDNQSASLTKGSGFVSADHSSVNKVSMADLLFTPDKNGKTAYEGIKNVEGWSFATADLIATVMKETGFTPEKLGDKILEVAAAFEKTGDNAKANQLFALALKSPDWTKNFEAWAKYGGWIQAAASGIECTIDVSRSNTDDEKIRAIAQMVGTISANHIATVITDLVIAAALSIPAVATAFAAAPVAVTIGIIAVSTAIGWAFGTLVNHGIEHPEDNAFAIFINWFYDHSSIPEKISEWWYDVRYGDKNGYKILVNWFYDKSSLPGLLTELWYDFRYRGTVLQDRDDRRVDYGQNYEFIPFDELVDDDEDDPDAPFKIPPEHDTGCFDGNTFGGRYQGLKALRLID